MAQFHIKKSIGCTYIEQGYVYFTSRNYSALPRKRQERIEQLAKEVAGEYADALLEFVTTDKGYVAVSQKYHLSERTLYGVVAKYYQGFVRRRI